MATFGTWLKVQLDRQDRIGEFSRMWEQAPNKPKASSPTGIWKHFETYTNAADIKPLYDAAVEEYQSQRGSHLSVARTAPDPAEAITDLASINQAFAEIRETNAEVRSVLMVLASAQGLIVYDHPWFELGARIATALDNLPTESEAHVALRTVYGWMNELEQPEPVNDWNQLCTAADWGAAREEPA